VTEREGVEVSLLERRTIGLLFFSIFILVIAKIFTTSVPALLLLEFFLSSALLFLGSFVLFLRIDENFHAIVIKTLRFDHIKHVEFDLKISLSISNSEVEPLGVTFGVHIILKNEVVFIVILFVRKLEVA
jgi:hypothetical protein